MVSHQKILNTKITMSEAVIQQPLSLLQQLKEARDSDAVLKMELMSTKERVPNTLIFVFEGDDDKIVYVHWIQKVAPDLQYEPLPMRGKPKVLRLHDVVLRDRTGLASNVYFFVDRDFDDLQGRTPSASIFMTEHYSVENYLVTCDVLRQFLTNEYHCHGNPETRATIIEAFEKMYGDFLHIIAEANARMFLARKIGFKGDFPDKLSAFVDVELSVVTRTYEDITKVIKLQREPNEEEKEKWLPEFRALEPSTRFRGKYNYKFFERWLRELAQDFTAEQSVYFNNIDRTPKPRVQELTLGGMASKAAPPANLAKFLSNIPVPA